MQPRSILILLLALSSIFMIGFGGYLTIDNLIQPKGYLFEGITLFALGSILLVLMTTITYLIKTVDLFTQIYGKQVEMQQEMSTFYTKSLLASQRPRSLGDILGGLGPSSISVTNMETGETQSTPLSENLDMSKIQEIMNNVLNGKPIPDDRRNPKRPSANSLNSMSIEQLEKELATAVKDDNFELAKEIKEAIHKKKFGSQDADNQSEEN